MTKINNFDFLIGADPEFFIKKCGSEDPVSAFGLVSGTKEEPTPVENGAVQVDGMALEFNINPVDNSDDFEKNLVSVMDQLMGMVEGFEIFSSPVANFSKEYLESQPEDATRLGCQPDFNAYTGEVNPTPDDKNTFRTASGHIHIGWTEGVDPMNKDHFKSCQVLTKALDVYLGIPSLLFPLHYEKKMGIEVDPKADKIRRSLYGRAGAFRPKPYGMEYRTLSNLWLYSPTLRKFVYGNTIEAIKTCFKDDTFFARTESKVVDLINGGELDPSIAEIFWSYNIPKIKDYE